MGLERARITNTDTGERIDVMFNPEEYSLSKDNSFAQHAVPGLRAPLIQFAHGGLRTLDMELLVDTYEAHTDTGVKATAKQDVREITSKITGLLDIVPKTHAPPVLLFTWGSLTFRCVLARVTERFIMFLPTGIPVRARLTVTFNEFTNAELEAKEIKRETADYTKLHVLGEGETVSIVAALEYGRPELWRPIAIRNGVDDPRQIAAGRSLQIPQLPFVDPETGDVYQ